jgi:hypothetical protein
METFEAGFVDDSRAMGTDRRVNLREDRMFAELADFPGDWHLFPPPLMGDRALIQRQSPRFASYRQAIPCARMSQGCARLAQFSSRRIGAKIRA